MAVQTITYDDKTYINQNADIPAINKVNDTDMNEIKSVVNNNANVLSNLITYSYSETLTNKIWIDENNIEHQIYRKIINVGSLTKNTEKTVSSNANIDFFTDDLKGFYNFSTFIVPVNFSNLGTSYSNANYSYCFYDKNNQEFRIKTTYNGVTGCYLIIEYVKASN